MYAVGVSEADRLWADVLFKRNMYKLIQEDRLQWRWLVTMRMEAADAYYYVVQNFGEERFKECKQKVFTV